MPIINGQKMACAPCIRGHRSTKCNHYLERVMVPVRKPGRPLSTCPCPPGRPCACGGVRIAIPKKQRCLCPSVPLHEPDGSEQESSPTETPTSPTRPAFRIGKPSGAGKASSRKQSFDPASLERMDPRSINLIASPNGSNGLNGITNGVNGVSMTSPGEAPTGMVGYAPPMAMMPAGPTSSFAHPPPPNYGATMAYSMGPLQYPVRPQMSPNIKTENGGYTPPLNGNYGVAMTTPYVNGSQLDGFSSFSSPPQPSILGPSPISKANGSVSAGGSCCGSKAQAPTPITTPAPTPAATSQPTTSTPQQGDGTQTGGGNCCSGKRSAQAPQLDMNNMPPPQPALSAPQQGYAASSGGGGCCGSKPQIPHPDLNNMSPPQQGYGQPFASQFSPVDMKIGDMNVFHFPTVFTYPAGFGSWQQPINPTIWQEVASRPAMQLENPISPTTNGGISGGDTIGNSHECSCGEGCQCVGCLAHPFNEQMFQYVNNAYSSNSSSANGSANGGSPNAGPALGGASAELAAAGTAGGHQTLGGRPETPPQAPTPNNESSPASEEESLSSFDYFFVNLPISGLCEGNIALCPCGDDCNCVGCLVHNTSGM